MNVQWVAVRILYQLRDDGRYKKQTHIRITSPYDFMESCYNFNTDYLMGTVFFFLTSFIVTRWTVHFITEMYEFNVMNITWPDPVQN